MDKSKLYIIRHAECTGNIENRLTGLEEYPLTKKGEETSEMLALELEDIKFDVAYSSTNNRTKETIQKLAQRNNIKIVQLKELCEMYFGIYDGWTWEDVNNENPKIKQNPNRTNEIMGIEKQETTQEVADRMYKCITNICKENKGKTILICSHGVAIEAFLRKITKIPFKYLIKKFCQHNGAINELEYNNETGKFTILRMSDTKYNEKRIKEKTKN